MRQQKDSNRTYTILVPSTQGWTITVEAPSPEIACKKLQRQIAGKQKEATDISSALVWDVWSDPSQAGDEWLIAPVESNPFNPASLMSWNGDSIKLYRDIGRILRKTNEKTNEE